MTAIQARASETWLTKVQIISYITKKNAQNSLNNKKKHASTQYY